MKVTLDPYKIRELYRMQAQLDHHMMQPPRRVPDATEIEIALMTEIGEALQEAKGYWCWWKLTQKPVDRAKLLEELADVLHFALSYELKMLDNPFPLCLQAEFDVPDVFECPDTFSIMDIIRDICDPLRVMEITWSFTLKVRLVFELAIAFHFSPDELYDAYVIKNRENFERISNGY